jgi:hypothetical protein
MAHYALLDENNVVIKVITGKNEDEQRDGVDVNWEVWYRDYHGVADCKRTSFNTSYNVHALGGTPFRGNYAGEGHIYDVDNDVFYEPKPHAAYVMDESTWKWKAPVDMPDDAAEGNAYTWDDTTNSWVEYTVS